MYVLIRCRASERVGFGHLVRCRVLAKAFLETGFKTIIIGPSEEYKQESDKKLFVEWIERPEWESSEREANFLLNIANKYNAHHIILDDYRSDFQHQYLLRQAGMKMLLQYDASKEQKFAAQIVINSSPYERREFYHNALLSDNIKTLMGPKYAILRPEFTRLSQEYPKKNHILVTYGGGDDRGAVLNTLSAIKDNIPKDYKVITIIGKYNPNIGKIISWIECNNYDQKIELKINPDHIETVIAECKLALLGGGTTTFEAAYFGLPMIQTPIAKNQYNQGKGWDELGVGVYLGPHTQVQKNILKDTFMSLITDTQRLEIMAQNAKKSVSNNGAEVVIKELLAL